MTISLAFLAPDLVKAAIDGRLPHGMGVARLCDLPAEWSRQPPDAGPHLSAIVEPVSTYDVSVAGKQNSEPRDNSAENACSLSLVSAETRTRAAEPANSQLFASRQEISANARLRGGGCSPDRTGLHLKFPASREFSREFFEEKAPRAILASKTRAGSIAYEQIPCSTEQGIFLQEQGIVSREQGILRS